MISRGPASGGGADVVPATTAALAELIDPDAEVRVLGSGYQFTEGPVWHPHEGCFYFHDIPGDTRWRWTEERGMEQVLAPTFKANGMAVDRNGDLLVCEQGISALARFPADGPSEIIASHFEGTYLNSPNDVVVRASDGSIYFTDPDYGRWNDWIGQERNRLLGFQGVYRLATDGALQLVVARDEFEQPNGLCFSPDVRLLYINDSARCLVKVFEVAGDGSLANGRLFAEGIGTGVVKEGNVDGMECDEYGNVWVTGPEGVWVLTPAGEPLGVVRTPEVVGSLAWGGEDLRTLLLTTSTTVHVVRTRVGPAPLPPLA
jgi:gluconolactonase